MAQTAKQFFQYDPTKQFYADPTQPPDQQQAQPGQDQAQPPASSSPAPAQQNFFGVPPATSTSPRIPTFDEYVQQHGHAPIASAPETPHRGKLASIMLGIGQALGNPLATRLGEYDRARNLEAMEYNRSKPALQYQANVGAYEKELGNEKTAGDIGKTTAETGEAAARTNLTNQQTENLKLNPPGKAEFLKELQSRRALGEDDPQQLAQEYLVRAPYSHVTRQEVYDVINNTPEQPPQAKIGPQGIAEPVKYRGRVYNGSESDAPDVVKAAFAAAKPVESTIHSNKLQEQAASRSNITLKNELGEKTQTLEKGRGEASKHLQTLREAQNQNELVQQLASSKSPTDQTSLAFKALGLDLPDGVHRINETELNAIRNQGSLSDRAYRALLNWTTGQQFAPDILNDIKSTAQKIAQSKMKTANDNLEDVNRVYGYKAPGSNDSGRFDSAPQNQNSSPAPQTHKFSKSAWKKANPQGDVNAAAQVAKQQGYDVVD